MKDDEIIYCVIAFILGYFLSRQMGNGFNIGGEIKACNSNYLSGGDCEHIPGDDVIGCEKSYMNIKNNGVATDKYRNCKIQHGFWSNKCVRESQQCKCTGSDCVV